MRSTGPPPDDGTIADASPFGEDWQLVGLYLCYELHYRGLAGVDAAREWDPDLLKARAALERPFLKALRHQATRHERTAAALDDLLVEPVDGIGVTHYLQDDGELWQLR
ncbi:iron-containing redox enzyme family protein, partial [Streptomyces mirabilis]